MEDILKMDIFFVVATIGIVLVTVCVVMVLLAIRKLVRTIDRIASEVEEEAVALRGDIAEARSVIKREGVKAQALVGAAAKIGKNLLGRASKRS